MNIPIKDKTTFFFLEITSALSVVFQNFLFAFIPK